MLNHFAFGYNRMGNLNQSAHVDEGWPSKIGLKNVPDTHFPQLRFSGAAYQGGGIGGNGILGRNLAGGYFTGSTILQDDFTLLRSRHHFRIGFELRRYYFNSRTRTNDSGEFTFSALQTQLPGFADSTGHAFASFLLGAVASTTRNVNVTNFGYRSSQPAFYIADDWKVSRKLTLNLGLRWELVSPLTEVARRMSALDPEKPNPDAGGHPGALVFLDDLGRSSFQNWYYRMAAPRFGFAWSMAHTVLRGGYGINNTPHISNAFGFPGTAGYNGNISLSPAMVALRFPQDPVMYLHDPYPAYQGTLPSKNPALSNGMTVSYIAPDSNRLPYVQNYHLSVQHELPRGTLLDVAYIGNKGTRLQADNFDNLNQLPVSALAIYGDRLIQQVAANPGLVALPYPGFRGTVAQALMRFPQYARTYQHWPGWATSNYNALQITATRRFTGGLAVLAAYSFSKAISIVDDSLNGGSALDIYNRRLERSVTSYNVPQSFRLSWIYEAPVRGRGVAGRILGGWSLSGVHQYRSGNPLSVATSGLNNPLGSTAVRPDLVSGVPVVIYEGKLPRSGTQCAGCGPRPSSARPVAGTRVNRVARYWQPGANRLKLRLWSEMLLSPPGSAPAP